ncbi:hypothetical protein [Spongiimicrobium salis]|uniref:hypothetical protein n=1 Tax=Spongiimicrobium salis TaxID=1667022 RepID=UPI00374C9478
MKNKIGLVLLVLVTLSYSGFAKQQHQVSETKGLETITINPSKKTVLLDGRCGNDEWEAATKIDLPAGASIYLMYDEDYFYFCACGKAEDYTILDLYIAHGETNQLHKFHLSAQMGEHILTDGEWKPASGKWELKGYAGFWVPYSGLADPEKRIDPQFAKGTHRQMQISRKKFAGQTWKMMFGLGGIQQEGDGGRLLYPEKAVEDNTTTWGKFSFSK